MVGMQIEISKKSYEFLKSLVAEIDSQDNRCTASPYFYVIQEKEKRVVPDGFEEDTEIYYDGESYSEEEFRESFGVPEGEDIDAFAYSNGYEIEWFGFTRDYEERSGSNVFFTERAYRDHVSINGHNLKEPRSFVKHAFRNAEMENLFDALRDITREQK